MSSSPDDFSGLRSLLKLKRFERPSSDYFDGLSKDVIHRLRGPEGLREQSLLQGLGAAFGWKPAVFYALGIVCSGLACYGLASLVLENPGPGIETAQGSPGFASSAPGQPEAGNGVLTVEGPRDFTVVSTNPVFTPGSSVSPIDPFRIKPTPVRYQQ